MQFCATTSGFQPSPQQLIVQQPKDKGTSPNLCKSSAWRCGWLCRSLIVQATREREAGMAVTLQDMQKEGRNGLVRATLPSLLFLFFFFHSLSPKLAAGRQMNAVWSEPTEVQGPAVQATKELHARHLLFSYQNTFSHVPPFPCSFPIRLPPQPCNIHSVKQEPSLSFTPLFFNSIHL